MGERAPTRRLGAGNGRGAVASPPPAASPAHPTSASPPAPPGSMTEIYRPSQRTPLPPVTPSLARAATDFLGFKYLFFLQLAHQFILRLPSPLPPSSPAARAAAPPARGSVRVQTAADKMSGIVFEPFNEVRKRERKERGAKRKNACRRRPRHLRALPHPPFFPPPPPGEARAGRRRQGRRHHRLPGPVRLHGGVRGGRQRADQVSVWGRELRPHAPPPLPPQNPDARLHSNQPPFILPSIEYNISYVYHAMAAYFAR